jgi:glycosyltransferase involved in cell wall biosynthesis
MSLPLISIGLPIYNGATMIDRALQSILSQDFEDFELIICDNASTDDTAQICETYARHDKRIHYVRNGTNIGVSPNHNRVFELSRGKYFAYSAHDVEQLPGMLSRCVREMERASRQVVLAYPRCEQIDENGLPVGGDLPSIASDDPRPHRRLGAVIWHIGYVVQHFGLFLSDALRKTRLNGSYASSDFVLTAELAMLGEIREIPEVLVRRRVESNGGTRAVLHDKKAWAEWLDPRVQNQRFVLRKEERLALEYVRASLSLPLNPKDKLACAVAGPWVHYRRLLAPAIGIWRRRLGRLKRGLVR